MHVDSWWDSYLEHGGTPKTSVYIYIYSDVHTIRTSGLESFYYMNIQCRTTTIFKIYYIYTGFSKMHVDSWWDSYLEHGGTPKTSVYIYIYSDVHTIRTSGLESFYYMNIQCRTTTIFRIYYIYTGFSKMHVDSWWDSYLEHGGTPKTSVYIYSDVHTIRTSGLESFYYMNIQCRTTTIFKIYYIYTGFSKMHVDSWWDSYLEHGGTPKTSVYIYIQRCTYDSNIRFGKFLLYEYIVPDNYNIQNILYIHRIFQNARRQLVGFLLRTWRNPQNLCVYIYIYSDVHTIRTSGLASFYYMNIQCRTTTIFKIYYIYTGFSKMHVDSWWDSYLEHGGTPKTSVYIYIQRCTYDSNIRFGKFLLYEYIVPDNYTIQNILYIHRIFQNARRQLVELLRTWRNPQNLCVYIYIAMYIRFEHQVWKVFII